MYNNKKCRGCVIMGKDIKFSFSLDGIGPHYDKNKIDDSFNSSAPRLAIYAENGTGKTFFTRMFALSENGANIEDNNRLISIDKKTGTFKFSIKSPDIEYTYSVDLEHGKPPFIEQQGKKYLYHVFNSDYVSNNIVSTDFSPSDGNVTGYILGKENIDVSEEKDQLKTLNEQIETQRNNITQKLSDAKAELASKKINRSLNEFKEINYDNIFGEKSANDTDDYYTLCQQLSLLKNIPEEIPVIAEKQTDISCDFLLETETLLKTKFNKVHFDEKAMEKIKHVRNHTSFFENGVSIFENQQEKICPFCSQELSEIGIYYINLYKYYFEQEESNVLSDIEQHIRNVSYLINIIDSFEKKYFVMSERFLRYRIYIPEMSNFCPEVLPKLDDIKKNIENISKQLVIKKQDISKTDFNISTDIEAIKNYILKLNDISSKLLLNSNKLQRLLDDSNNSRLSLCRKICNTRRNILINECKIYINNIKELNSKCEKIKASIKEKERKAKTSKREVVVEALSMFLDYFFHQKYVFDEKTFGISFKGKSLDTKAKDVLSDGEKSIVAFCYYLASTHLLINNESDYEDIFFIIDDPISSMDFNYVYAVSDIIRHLSNSFPQIEKIRYIIFTHNAEFMSILYRNRIPKLSISMTKGKLDKMNSELLMPYEYHLNDIICVANETQIPTYTTPNSIRQVIETIMRFESPKEDSTEKYILNNPLLCKNSYIYSLMQDGSHGAVRKALPFSAETLKEACKIVVQFVKSKYPAQINEN